MKTLDAFNTFSQSLRPLPSKAQIILQVLDEGPTVDCALELLKSAGIENIHYDYLRKSDPFLVVLYLSTEDMREAVLKLTEAGFPRLKAINQKHSHSKRAEKEHKDEK